jgi:hypothetical protein
VVLRERKWVHCSCEEMASLSRPEANDTYWKLGPAVFCLSSKCGDSVGFTSIATRPGWDFLSTAWGLWRMVRGRRRMEERTFRGPDPQERVGGDGAAQRPGAESSCDLWLVSSRFSGTQLIRRRK